MPEHVRHWALAGNRFAALVSRRPGLGLVWISGAPACPIRGQTRPGCWQRSDVLLEGMPNHVRAWSLHARSLLHPGPGTAKKGVALCTAHASDGFEIATR